MVSSITADPTITGFTVRDLRFPTSLDAIGSDPMKYAAPHHR